MKGLSVRKRLELAAYASVLVHLLVLEGMVLTNIRFLHAFSPLKRKSVVFVDTSNFPGLRLQDTVSSTPLISERAFKASDMVPGGADDIPALAEPETDVPPEVPRAALDEPPVEREEGPGRSSEPEMRLTRRGMSGEGVPNTGAFMYNIKKHDYADYYKHIKDKVVLTWRAEHGHDLIGLLRRRTKATVLFRVEKDGRITSVRQGAGSSDHLELVTKLMKAVKNAGPLEPFPDKIVEPYLNIRFDFHF